MNKAERMEALKVDLGISGTAYDARLNKILDEAQNAIEKEGAQDDGSPEYDAIVIMYAIWRWSRRDSMEGMPAMLRYKLNNAIFRQHVEGV